MRASALRHTSRTQRFIAVGVGDLTKTLTLLACRWRNSAFHCPDLEVNVIDLEKSVISNDATTPSAVPATFPNWGATMPGSLDGSTVVTVRAARGWP
jgi:hypothetical protein